MARLILASSSPRRRELMLHAGYEFQVRAPSHEAEVNAPTIADPEQLVLDLAHRKGQDVVGQVLGRGAGAAWVLSADTIAEYQGRVLGKPDDSADARRMLSLLSGTRHHVLTGVTLWNTASAGAPVEAIVAKTTLQMDELTPEWIESYLASGQWEGKAGAFGYQDGIGVLRVVEGSESNVVGLPMEECDRMLQQHAHLIPRAQDS
ncbi:MAG: septum formation protein Maf [Planctomycetales bacterium]|nr:septum formation protein Maf [Planctomycetales bacterium]